jgi:hypothetical protein
MRFSTTAMSVATLLASRSNRPAAQQDESVTGGWLARMTNTIGTLIASRRRRAAQDDAFYRDLAAYCRANKVTPVCEDDWKTRG